MRERALLAATLAATAIVGPASEVKGAGLEDIATIVVIYAENRESETRARMRLRRRRLSLAQGR
jgi:hypothetical protein